MHSDILNYTKLAFNSLKMIQNDTVYQPIKQLLSCSYKTFHEKPDESTLYFCYSIMESYLLSSCLLCMVLMSRNDDCNFAEIVFVHVIKLKVKRKAKCT